MLKTATADVTLPPAIVEANYAGVQICSNGFFNVRKNWKWGYANSKGELITPIKYATPADFENGIAMVRYDRSYFHIDEQGNEHAI
jgi:hypothetical protein